MHRLPVSLAAVSLLALVALASPPDAAARGRRNIDAELSRALRTAGFTGEVGSSLEDRLGRPVDDDLADLGRLLWFDTAGGLHDDNICGGCHAPATGFGDTQSIAIGIQNNNLVGPSRTGPRNQRRSPSVINAAFYPALMWNGRFSSGSGDPFDNSGGFLFPQPEGSTEFPAGDAVITHLLMAQAFIPPTELVEVAGFTGTAGTISPAFDVFDDGLGQDVPPPDASGYRNAPIRDAVMDRLNANAEYVSLFGANFPDVAAGDPIDYTMFARAIAEFEFTLTFADAPIDRYARGDRTAMTREEKEGALLFFGRAGCSACHAVSGDSNEMFSDFENHVLAVPQIAPEFGVGTGNMIFDGPGADEDYGREQFTGSSDDRYAFRTTPLRNVAMQAAFFHNGAYTSLEDAILHHLDVVAAVTDYDPAAAGVDVDLEYALGPMDDALDRLDPLLISPTVLTDRQFNSLVAFVRDGLLDERAADIETLCALVPTEVPSGYPMMEFEGCEDDDGEDGG